MFYQHSNGSSSLPRGFRFRHEEDQPRTPEPLAADEPQPPSPPRPAPRLKIRRRNGMPNFEAPTETFLASVTAADVPIPTIEVPQSLAEDSDMPDREAISITTTGLLAPSTFNYRLVSPPKTPVPMLSAEEEIQRPDWSRGVSSEPEYFERPMSASSNFSDFSDDSFYDGVSRPSDDGSCTSPESDISDPFQFPPVFKSKNQDTIPPYLKSAQSQNAPLNAKLRSKTRSDAPWSKAMSEHLWQTYLIYLQDPTVTPFRIGASAVPPEGVCHRVAREAKRSWKGPKLAVPTTTIRRSARLNLAVREPSHDTDKSGSITPTGETIPKVYGQWPHSSVATRSHLRELCKTKDSTSVSRHRYFQTRSPTPFTKSRTTHSRLRTPEPDRCAGAFNTHDISFSLVTSTAESMQPDGPLAKLATGDGSCDMETNPSLVWQEENRARRLGSPFIARTYGPSSSKPMSERPRPPRTRSDTVAAIPSLRSPLRFDNSRFDKTRSLNSTQKRRAANALDEEDIIRPSILNDQLFGGHLRDQRRVRSRGFSLGDEALRHCAPGLFQHAFSGVDSLPQGNTISTIPEPTPSESTATPSLLPSATFDSAGSQGIRRLGSPFSESVSNTFPRRLFQDGVVNPNHTVKRSAFATMHQTRRSIESFDFGEGPSLQSRLSQLDNKLAEIRRREATSRRTGS